MKIFHSQKNFKKKNKNSNKKLKKLKKRKGLNFYKKLKSKRAILKK